MKPKLILGLALVLSGGLFGCWFFASQLFQDCRLAKFPSPNNPANEAWFMDGGFQDRDLILCVKPEGKKLQSLANLCWFPDCAFSSAQWSNDGQVIVCSVNAKNAGDKPVMVVAFDFSKNKRITPLWMSVSGFENKPETEWRKQEAVIKVMIATHGGLRDKQINDEVVRSKEKTLWFWQVPKF
jgi:hypothetical protein